MKKLGRWVKVVCGLLHTPWLRIHSQNISKSTLKKWVTLSHFWSNDILLVSIVNGIYIVITGALTKFTAGPSLSWRQSLVPQHTHINPINFQCQVCLKNFRQKSDCERHSRIHTGEKPYKCDMCEQTFSLKYNMRDHMRRKHGRHGNTTPYKCVTCGIGFADQTQLDLHTKQRHPMCS